MQQAEETHAVAESECGRGLRLILNRAVGEAQLVECVGEFLVVGRVGRIKTGEDHGLGLPIARQRIRLVTAADGHRVADSNIGDILETGRDVADVAGGQRVLPAELGRETADLHRFESAVAGGETERGLALDVAVDDSDMRDDSLVGVVFGVEDQRSQWFGRFALRRRDALDDRVEQFLDALAGLG